MSFNERDIKKLTSKMNQKILTGEQFCACDITGQIPDPQKKEFLKSLDVNFSDITAPKRIACGILMYNLRYQGDKITLKKPSSKEKNIFTHLYLNGSYHCSITVGLEYEQKKDTHLPQEIANDGVIKDPLYSSYIKQELGMEEDGEIEL